MRFSKIQLIEAGVALSFLALALTGFSALLGADVPEFSWLEFAAVTTSYVCTLLATQQYRMQYYWGLVTTALYVWLFATNGLPASATLNAILTIQLIYGFFRWGSDDNSIPVTRTKLKEWPLYVVSTTALYGVTWLAIRLIDGEGPPLLDCSILALSILAQWLLDNKKVETWFVWILVNIVSIFVYFRSGLWQAGWQYVFFLGNAFYGCFIWFQDIPKDIEK